MIKVIILGLLNKLPMHGYRIKEELEKGNYEIWANININSIYNALKTLEKKEYIIMKEIIHKGNQTKSVYCITEKGKKEYKSLLFKTISSSNTIFPGDLYIGLSFINDMPEMDAIKAIDSRLNYLKDQIENWKIGQSKKCNKNNDPFLTQLFNNGISHLKTDYDYLLFIRDNFNEYITSIEKIEKEYIRSQND